MIKNSRSKRVSSNDKTGGNRDIWDGEENPSVREHFGDFFRIGHATSNARSVGTIARARLVGCIGTR
jgi:hypothetical protein